MKSMKLNLIKKNRVYFKCLNDKNYEVKLKITDKSEHLTLGEHELLLNDISIRSKYGVDVIYEVENEITEPKKVFLQHRYNTILVDACRNLGGKWDSDAKVWVFPSIVEDKVEELDFLYNSQPINIEIKNPEQVFAGQESVTFLGYVIATATGRDSGAVLGENISMLEGTVCSGGSMKNWGTGIKSNSVFRLSISRELLKTNEDDQWEIKIL